MRRAIIDLGTHSVLLLIIDDTVPQSPRLPFTVIADLMRICRLGEGLYVHHILLKSAQERVFSSLTEYKTLCDKYGVEDVTLLGTEACRRAKNCDEFRRAIWKKFAWTLTVISAETEASLAYLGACLDFKDMKNPIVIDPGGGSTEFIYEEKIGKLISVSIPIGSVVLSEQFVHHDPPLPGEYRDLSEHVDAELQNSLKTFPRAHPLIALAGTATTLAAIALSLAHYDSGKIQGYCLLENTLSQINARLWRLSVAERRTIPGLHPGRAEVILGGALLLLRILAFFGTDRVWVSDRGVRYGFAFKLKAPLKTA